MVITLDVPDLVADRLQNAAEMRGSDLQEYALSALSEIADRDFQASFDDAAWWQSLSAEQQQAEISSLENSFARAEAGGERPLSQYAASLRPR